MSDVEAIRAAAASCTDARRRALQVIADGHKNRRPVSVGQRTTGPGDRLLKVARAAADSLVRDGFLVFDTPWEIHVELTPAGRMFCQELDL